MISCEPFCSFGALRIAFGLIEVEQSKTQGRCSTLPLKLFQAQHSNFNPRQRVSSSRPQLFDMKMYWHAGFAEQVLQKASISRF